MFRRWHPPEQRTSTSGRSTQRNAPSRPSSQLEDAQPNESVNKRQRVPPSVNSVAIQQQQQQQQQQPWRARQRNRRDMQFAVWQPPGFTRPSARNTTSTPASAAQPASDHAWRPRNLPSAPSSVPPSAPRAPKRRKLKGAPFAEIRRESPPREKIVSAAGPSSSALPIASETLVHRIKRERSLSPELSAVPQVITAGSKRYAPLPPECRKSQPNHKAARNAWAKKEQKALKRLGLRVVRTFIREDGMVIDWETTDSEPVEADAVIERALLLNHAGALAQSMTMPFLAHKPPNSDQPCVGEETSRPSVAQVASQTVEGHSGCESIQESGSRTGFAQISEPSGPLYQEGGFPQRKHPWQTTAKVDAPPPAARLGMSPGKLAHDVPSDHTWRHKAVDDAPSSASPPSDRVWRRSSSPQVPHPPSQHHSISPQLPQSLPSPSRRAIDTLQHIFHMKRQFVRQSPDSLKPPVASSPPSTSLRKLYPVPKTPQPGGSSGQSPGSSADAVAAAINVGALLDRRRSTTTPSPKASEILHVGNVGSAGPQTDEEHQMRRTQSSGEHSSPPIAVLAPIASSPLSWKASSSACGEEYDELELSYPPSPMPAPPEASEDLLDPHHPALVVVSPGSPPQAELLVGPTLQDSFSDISPPSPDENTTMQSSALRYFQRYCRTFDKDRRALAGMYAGDAFFSCSSRDLHVQGRDDVLDALEALGPGVLCSGHSVDYDVTYLGPNIGVLLVALGTMNDTRDGTGEVRYAMSFVLHPRGEDQERPTGGSRPLVAAVHQMVLRRQGDTHRVSVSGVLMMPSAASDDTARLDDLPSSPERNALTDFVLS